MKIAICDDEALCREQMQALVRQYGADRPQLRVSVSVFAQSEALLEAVHKGEEFDVFLLDVLMPGLDGIQLGLQLRQAGANGKILYLTSSEDYAIDAYRVKAFDYLLKPIGQQALFEALDQAAAAVEQKKKKSLIVKTKESSIRLDLDSILYAVLERRTVIYHLTDGRTVSSVSIRTTFAEAVQKLLQDKGFVLCGASMVANLQHITMVETEALVFGGTEKVYLGRKACRELRSVWYDYWFEEGGCV